MLPLILLIGTAHAAPADWTNYLCRFGEDKTTALVRVNEKDERVTIDDRDMNDVKFKPDEISFKPPRGGVWLIKRPSLAMSRLYYIPPGLPKIEEGDCRIVD